MDRSLNAGSVLAERYKLERLIGEGGMGSVWSAHHVVTLKKVAVKILRGRIDDNPQAQRRFTNEARAAASIDHPNVIEVTDAFVLDGKTPVIVMELLEGESLRERLERDEVLSLDELGETLGPVLSALGEAHRRGIVHRDLKPDNVFLARGKEGTHPVVLDFGLAKLFSQSSATLKTLPGSRLGTPHYMAPEQARGSGIDHRVDVWALGVIIYECLAGVRPVEGVNTAEILKRVVTEAIVPLEALEPGLPQSITSMVARMLSRDAADRPELSEVAQAFAPPDDTSWSVAPDDVVHRAVAKTQVQAPEPPLAAESLASHPGPSAPAAKNSWRVGLIAAAVLLAAVGLFLGIWRLSAREAAAPTPKKEAPAATNISPQGTSELPIADVRGQPTFNKDGLWIWRKRRGRWLIRATAHDEDHRYEGTLSGVVSVLAVQTEGEDALRKNGDKWEFSFVTDNSGDDGVTFMSPAGCVHFDLKVDGKAQPKRIFLGRAAKNPDTARFSICGKLQ